MSNYNLDYHQLFAAVVVQAVKDLSTDDMILALDALCFFIDERGAVMWLDAVASDYPSDTTKVFKLAVLGAANGNLNLSRGAAKRTRANEQKPNRLIQVRAGEKSTGLYKEHSNQGAAVIA